MNEKRKHDDSYCRDRLRAGQRYLDVCRYSVAIKAGLSSYIRAGEMAQYGAAIFLKRQSAQFVNDVWNAALENCVLDSPEFDDVRIYWRLFRTARDKQ